MQAVDSASPDHRHDNSPWSSQLTPAGTVSTGYEQFLTERGDERSDLRTRQRALHPGRLGQPPFTGHNVIWILVLQTGRRTPIDSLRPHLPPALTTLVAELLDRDPAPCPRRRGRPRSASAASRRPSPPAMEVRRSPWPGAAGQGGRRDEGAARQQATLLEAPHMRPILQCAAVAAVAGEDGSAIATVARFAPAVPHVLDRYGAARDLRGPSRRRQALLLALVSSLVTVGGSEHLLPPSAHPIRRQSVGAHPRLRVHQRLHRGLLHHPGCRGPPEQAKEARRRPEKPAWTLHVGPQYIVTAGSNGRREFAWDQIQSVTIEEIKGSSPYRYTGVHVQLAPGVSRPPKIPPAG